MDKDSGQLALTILAGLFVGCLVISAVLAAKIITVFGLVVPAGVLGYCITFVCTDTISEIWGRKQATQVVTAGFLALLTSLVLIQLALYWPKAEFWQKEEAFWATLQNTPRIILASLSAYLASQYTDVHLFHLGRKLTKGRHLWLRNNVSTAISQLLDSVVFICIGFWGQMPILHLIMGQWLVKLMIAALDTAVVYFVVGRIRGSLKYSECM